MFKDASIHFTLKTDSGFTATVDRNISTAQYNRICEILSEPEVPSDTRCTWSGAEDYEQTRPCFDMA